MLNMAVTETGVQQWMDEYGLGNGRLDDTAAIIYYGCHLERILMVVVVKIKSNIKLVNHKEKAD